MEIVLETTKFVVENSKNVIIDKDKIREFCRKFNKKDIRHWWNVAPFKILHLSNEEKLMFLLIFNSLSFSYWGNPKWTIDYKNKKINTASFGMILSIGKALEEGIPILSPYFLSKITKVELQNILRANVEIPLLEERLKIINEIGRDLLNNFEGKFSNLIKKSKNDCLNLLSLIVKNFPCFEDVRMYKKKKIYFYKRAQLLISDIHQLFSNTSLYRFKNIQKLTACADYKLPQILRKLGILKYSKILSDKIDRNILIPEGDENEVEIRANTIWAIEYIYQNLKNRILGILPIHINDYLWIKATRIPYSDKPYHKTRTISY